MCYVWIFVVGVPPPPPKKAIKMGWVGGRGRMGWWDF